MVDVAIPTCFLPLTETRSGETRFWDLAEYKFTRADKLFICKELSGESDLLPPTHVCKDGHARKTARGFAARHHVHHSKFSRWLDLYLKNEALYDSPGRPTALDDISVENIENRIINGNSTTQSLLYHDLSVVMKEEKKNTLIRRGKRMLPETEVNLSPSYVSKCTKILGIKARKPQDLTPARLAALRDIRLTYRIACCYEAFSGHLPATHKWNADATTMIVAPDKVGSLVCSIPGAEEKKKLDSSTVPNGLNLLVKWVLMASAQGETSPLVLIITIPDMKDGTFFAKKLVGLSGSQEIGASGWLYLCNSRAGNAALWQHWFKNVVIPTMQSCRDAHDEPDSSGEAARIFFSTDGEAVIMQEVFDPDILQRLEFVRCDMVKGGPSATSRHQACDVMVVFRDVKTGLKYHALIGTDTTNETLRRHMKVMCKEFEEEFSIELPQPLREKILLACEKITFVMRDKYVTPSKIAKGFVDCGQHVLGAGPGMSTVSYDRIMSASLSTDITVEEFDRMREMRPLVIAKFIEDGRVLNTYLDELGIVADPSATDRDNLTLCRQDCQLITHADTIHRYRQKNPPLPSLFSSPPPTSRTSAVSQVSEKQLMKAKKVVKAVLGRQAKAAAKEAAKAAHVDRRNAMTPAERHAEDTARRAATAAIATAKKAAQAAKEAAAMHLVGYVPV